MVGFYARGDASKPVRVDLDNELVGQYSTSIACSAPHLHCTYEDAQWYTRAEILAVLNHPTGTKFSGRDYKKLNDLADGTKTADTSAPETKEDEPPFRVPPTTAIAGVLIKDWAEGRIGFSPQTRGKGLGSNL